MLEAMSVGEGSLSNLDHFGGAIAGAFCPMPASLREKSICGHLTARHAILWDSSNPGMAHRVRETEVAADQSHVLLHTVGPRRCDR
jgi:hypothetical protein